jgi:hypothetical protein
MLVGFGCQQGSSQASYSPPPRSKGQIQLFWGEVGSGEIRQQVKVYI